MTTNKTEFVFIDIETTGLDPATNYITEISAVRTDSEGNELGRMSNLVKLPKGEKVPEFIVKLTGITDEMLEEEGVHISEALAHFAEFVQDATAVAQFAPFDFSFLEQHGAFENFYDTRTMSYYIDPTAKASLKDLAKRYNIEMTEHHRGMSDAVTAKGVFFAMREIIEPKAMQELRNCVGTSIQRRPEYIPVHTEMVVEFNEDGSRYIIDMEEDAE